MGILSTTSPVLIRSHTGHQKCRLILCSFSINCANLLEIWDLLWLYECVSNLCYEWPNLAIKPQFTQQNPTELPMLWFRRFRRSFLDEYSPWWPPVPWFDFSTLKLGSKYSWQAVWSENSRNWWNCNERRQNSLVWPRGSWIHGSFLFDSCFECRSHSIGFQTTENSEAGRMPSAISHQLVSGDCCARLWCGHRCRNR